MELKTRFSAEETPPIEPIAILPVGYFAGADSRLENIEANKMASVSSLKLPADLE